MKPVVKRKKHDVAVHTTNGTVIHRYEEVAPGKWKKIAELSPEQAAKEAKIEAPKRPRRHQDGGLREQAFRSRRRVCERNKPDGTTGFSPGGPTDALVSLDAHQIE